MLRSRPIDESLEEILGKSNGNIRRGLPVVSINNTAPHANSMDRRQRATDRLPPDSDDEVVLLTESDEQGRPTLVATRKSSVRGIAPGSRAAKVGQTVTKGVRKGVGAAGKGTVKATQRATQYVGKGVGKGVGVAGKGASKLGAKTAKGTYTATKLVAKNTVRVGKGTVGAVTNLPGNAVKGVTMLPGNAIHLAEHTVKGINNLAAWTLKRNEVAAAAAWKTRITSPVTKVELTLECQNLRRKDAFAECDAFCVLWQVPNGYGSDGTIGKSGAEDNLSTATGNMSLSSISNQNQNNGKRRKRPRVNQLPTTTEKEIGRTEIIKGCCDPQFTYPFVVDFKFQEEQTYVIRVYDRDLEFCPDLKEHDFLGGTVFTMGELMGVGKRELRRPLRSNGSNNKSQLCIRGTEVSSTRSVLQFRFNAQGLRESEKAVIDKDDDPYFQILKLNREDQSWEAVYKSEVLMHNNTPTWAKARLPLPVICNNDMMNPLKITFWDWRRADEEQSESLGYVETTARQLVDGAQRGIPVLDVQREHKRLFRRDKVKKSGQLKVLRAELQPVPTLAQYICGGCNMDLMIAVDCSVNNGDPQAEEGLHFREGLWLNDYQAAIHKIGTIMEPYSHSGDFTIYGFGGEIRGESVPLFPMGGDDGVVHGANGLLDAYDETFVDNPLYMEPAEGANIAPLIQSAMYRAIQNSEREHCYSVLCILTAGTIGDELHETIDTICTAAEDAPLSIIIIGVGENRTGFETIEQLAGLARDGKLRHSNGVPISRDIVGFASFNDFEGSAGNAVAESLKDLPEQVVEYFTNTGILPRPPQTKEDTMKDESRSSTKDNNRRGMKESSRRRTRGRSQRRGMPRGSKSPKKSSKARPSVR